MLLGIKTDAPEAELVLYDGKRRVASRLWQADRELAHRLLAVLEEFLQENNLTLADITGMFVFAGPGSFTGLRIGATVMNTLAYSLQIPIVATRGEQWENAAVRRLASGKDDGSVLPEYGALARVTQQKK